MKVKITELEDYGPGEKGSLICFLRDSDLGPHRNFQQLYISTIPLGVTRGNHFHKAKEEYLMVLTGRVRIMLEDINTKETKELVIDPNEKPIRIWIGVEIAHNITNISDELVRIVEYVTKSFDPDDKDRYDYALDTQ